MATKEREQAYYRKVAESVGVPEFWLEDATQDIALAMWRGTQGEGPYAVRRAAIDAVRRYGPRSRWGRVRLMHVPLEYALQLAIADEGTTFERDELRDAVRRAARRLTELERQALGRRLLKRPMSNADSLRASAARRKLRVELARLQLAS